MKILSKEEEREHYKYGVDAVRVRRRPSANFYNHSATLRGGIGGGLLGTALGTAGVYAASARYPAFRSLTVPFRAFLIVSTGSFAGM